MLSFFELIGSIARQITMMVLQTAWAIISDPGGFILTLIVGGGLSIYLISSYHHSPADEADYAKLKAYPNTCATHTFSLRLKQWRVGDPDYVVPRYQLNQVIDDCEEYDVKRAQQARQNQFMK